MFLPLHHSYPTSAKASNIFILSFLNIIFNVCLDPGSESPMEDSPSTDRLRFDRFDICRLLKHGASLLGSAGAEFEVQDDKSGISLYFTCKLENLLVWRSMWCLY